MVATRQRCIDSVLRHRAVCVLFVVCGTMGEVRRVGTRLSRYEQDDYISVYEASKWLEVSERRIRAMIKQRTFAGCVKTSEGWHIPLKSVAGYHKRKSGRPFTPVECTCTKPQEPDHSKHGHKCRLYVQAKNVKRNAKVRASA